MLCSKGYSFILDFSNIRRKNEQVKDLWADKILLWLLKVTLCGLCYVIKWPKISQWFIRAQQSLHTGINTCMCKMSSRWQCRNKFLPVLLFSLLSQLMQSTQHLFLLLPIFPGTRRDITSKLSLLQLFKSLHYVNTDREMQSMSGSN